MLKETQISELVSLGTLGAKATRPEIVELLDSMRDQELAYLAVEATRLVKRRLVRGQGRALEALENWLQWKRHRGYQIHDL